MEKKFTKHGNSIALVIDKPLLKMLNIDENATIVLSIKDGSLIITPKRQADTKHYNTIDAVADEIMDEYEDVFRKLSK
jgi:putative addiction module antidote